MNANNGIEPALTALHERLDHVQSEMNDVSQQHRDLSQRLESLTEERNALGIAIQSLGGELADSTERGPDEPLHHGAGERPKIRELAHRRARQRGGRLKVSELLQDTRAYGFKSDQGGLHTYLKGLPEFEYVAPGTFELTE